MFASFQSDTIRKIKGEKWFPEIKHVTLISESRIIFIHLIIVPYGHLRYAFIQVMRNTDFTVWVRHWSSHYSLFTNCVWERSIASLVAGKEILSASVMRQGETHICMVFWWCTQISRWMIQVVKATMTCSRKGADVTETGFWESSDHII